MSFYRTLCAGVLALVLLGAAGAQGASSKDPNWPCIQRKVPEITAGVVWSGPELPENNNSWKASSTVSDLVERLSQRRIPLEDANQKHRRVRHHATGRQTRTTHLAVLRLAADRQSGTQ